MVVRMGLTHHPIHLQLSQIPQNHLCGLFYFLLIFFPECSCHHFKAKTVLGFKQNLQSLKVAMLKLKGKAPVVMQPILEPNKNNNNPRLHKMELFRASSRSFGKKNILEYLGPAGVFRGFKPTTTRNFLGMTIEFGLNIYTVDPAREASLKL